MKQKKIRTYTELSLLESFDDRFEYLKLAGMVGEDTFGFDRYINQKFYRSKEWKNIRNFVITRDLGCDLGLEGFEISGRIIIHHMNPIDKDDIIDSSDYLLNPEYLVCVSEDTHNALHYGLPNEIPTTKFAERKPNDTKLW